MLVGSRGASENPWSILKFEEFSENFLENGARLDLGRSVGFSRSVRHVSDSGFGSEVIWMGLTLPEKLLRSSGELVKLRSKVTSEVGVQICDLVKVCVSRRFCDRVCSCGPNGECRCAWIKNVSEIG